MIIRELQPLGFGKFSGERFRFGEGFHVIYGENESGKTTLQWFIVGMLYGFFQPLAKRKTYTEEYSRYQPWNTGAPYAGVMVCEKDGALYRIERVFQKDMDSVNVYNHTTGEDITTSFPYNSVTRLYEPGETLTGVSKTVFCNTVWVAQGQCPFQAGLGKVVQEKLTAMVQTGDSGYSLQKAVALLEKYQEGIGTPRKSKTPYGAAAQKMQALEQKRQQAEEAENAYFDLLEKENSQAAKVQAFSGQIKEAEQKLLRLRQSQERQRYQKAEELQEQCRRLQEEQTALAPVGQLSQEELALAAQGQSTWEQNMAQQEQYHQQIEELWESYSSLNLASSQQELLEQFEAFADKYQQAAREQAKVNRSKKIETNLKNGLSQLHLLNQEGLKADIEAYNAAAQKGRTGGKTIVLLTAGMLVAAAGVVCGQRYGTVWYSLCAAAAILAGAGAVLWAKGRRKLPEIKKEQEALLKKYGVEAQGMAGLTELLGKVELNNYKYQQFQEQLTEAQRQIRQGKEAVYSLLQEVWAYVRELTGEEDADPGEITSKELQSRVQQGKELLWQIELVNRQRRQLAQSAGEEEGAAEQREEIFARCNVSTVEELKEKQQRLQEVTLKLQMSTALLQEILGGKSLEELQAAAQNGRTQPLLQSSSQELNTHLDQLKSQYHAVQQYQAQLKGQRQAMENTQCPVGEIDAQIAEYKEECAAYQQELDAIALAKERLEQAGENIQREFAPVLSREVSRNLSLLTGGKYETMLVTPELGLRLSDPGSGRLVEAAQLSQGAADLLYLTMRIHLGRALAGENRPPLLLDDTFAQIDQPRMEQMLRYLCKTCSEDKTQILLFTCHRREGQFLNGSGFPWSLTNLSE